MAKMETRFNPRAHAGRDHIQLIGEGVIEVSIHAPTRGATANRNPHLSAVGFNPRAHAGRDIERENYGRKVKVSIHAPTRGATAGRKNYTMCNGFQSTRPRGARPIPILLVRSRRRFNPRAHAGRDDLGQLGCDLLHRFNPRAHAGRDHQAYRKQRPDQAVSIHAPTRGATPAMRFRRATPDVSIHAPTRGATRSCSSSPRRDLFQSTRPRGARHDDQYGNV